MRSLSRQSRRIRNVSFRPSLESLERRCVLSQLQYLPGANFNFWDNEARWGDVDNFLAPVNRVPGNEKGSG